MAESVPKALGTYQEKEAEEVERERGNTEFKNGNFAAAVKSYTKCLGLKVNSFRNFGFIECQNLTFRDKTMLRFQIALWLT